MKRTLAIFALLAGTLAFAQTKTATNVTITAPIGGPVTLTWTASTSCTASTPCSGYIVYAFNGTCPATIIGSGGWTEFTQNAGGTPITAPPFVDSTEQPGETVSYFMEAVQNGVPSPPSACATVALPNAPAAPTGVTPTG